MKSAEISDAAPAAISARLRTVSGVLFLRGITTFILLAAGVVFIAFFAEAVGVSFVFTGIPSREHVVLFVAFCEFMFRKNALLFFASFHNRITVAMNVIVSLP